MSVRERCCALLPRRSRPRGSAPAAASCLRALVAAHGLSRRDERVPWCQCRRRPRSTFAARCSSGRARSSRGKRSSVVARRVRKRRFQGNSSPVPWPASRLSGVPRLRRAREGGPRPPSTGKRVKSVDIHFPSHGPRGSGDVRLGTAAGARLSPVGQN